MSRFPFAALVLVATGCWSVEAPLRPAPPATHAYEPLDLGTLGGNSTVATAINDRGQIVGWSFTAAGAPHAFLWEDGAMRDLGTLVAQEPDPVFHTRSVAGAINNAGLIAGSAEDESFMLKLVVWENGVIRALGPDASDREIRVDGMNARGDIVASIEPAEYDGRVVVWQNGVVQPVEHLPGGWNWTYATAMNGAGDVVGASTADQSSAQAFFHPFVWRDGVTTDLGVFGITGNCTDPNEPSCNSAEGEALDVNDAGVVVGWSQDSSGLPRPFIWQDGTLRDLGVFPGVKAYALAINERGQVAGGHQPAPWPDQRAFAFLWSAGAVQDLGTLGGRATHVSALSEAGEIVGSSLTASGEQHAFVWRNGQMTDLGLGAVGATEATAVAINERGDVVGVATTPGGSRAILWRPSPPD